MTTQLVLNSTNYNEDSGRFIVNFPVEQQIQGMQIAANNINIFNSFYNISAAAANNTITISFPSGTTYIDVSVTIPDGFYDVAAFTTYLEKICDENKLYILRSDGVTKKYFFYMGSNRSYQNLFLYYQVQPGVTPPTGATWVTPSTGQELTMYITWTKPLGALYGFTSLQIGDGINTSTSEVTSYLSDSVATPHTISSVVLLCNLIQNTGLSYPSSILTSLPVGGAAFGDLLTKTYPKREWNEIQDGQYKSLEITIMDQNLNRLRLFDTNALLVLSLRKK